MTEGIARFGFFVTWGMMLAGAFIRMIETADMASTILFIFMGCNLLVIMQLMARCDK